MCTIFNVISYELKAKVSSVESVNVHFLFYKRKNVDIKIIFWQILRRGDDNNKFYLMIAPKT